MSHFVRIGTWEWSSYQAYIFLSTINHSIILSVFQIDIPIKKVEDSLPYAGYEGSNIWWKY